jgi:hypothetical protein
MSQGMLVSHLSTAVAGTVLVGSTVQTTIGLIEIANTTAAIAYVQFFWLAAASVTLGTTVPNFVIPVPASGGVVLPFDGSWLTGGTAWSYASTTTATGNSAAAQYINIWRRM